MKFQGYVDAKADRPMFDRNAYRRNDGVKGNYTTSSIYELISINLVWVILKNSIEKSN